jgi:hypothetical protein
MKRFIVLMMMSVSSLAYAQKIKVIEGDVKALKGITSMRVEFEYDDMIVGKDLTEEQYIKDKKQKLNEKESGRGEKWEGQWIADRKERFEPQFKELFTKHSVISVSESAPYTLIFKTKRTEPGWNVGVMRVPAYIDGEVWFVDSANKNKVIAKLSVLKAPGRDAMGFDYETGLRLQEAYAKAGKEIAQYLTKATSK